MIDLKFKKISVTDDYTAEERQMIENKVSEARNKTETDGNGTYVYKVRGTPKTDYFRNGSTRPKETQ